MITSETFRGTLNLSLGYTYDNDFNLTNFTYAGSAAAYIHDRDGLLTGAGDFTIIRDSRNGLPKAVTSSNLNLTRTFNGYGEVEQENFAVNSQNFVSWNLTRDNAGRITAKTETAGDIITDNYAYTYDNMGRLLNVIKDGNIVEEYQYNKNGSRIFEKNAFKNIERAMNYSNEDHLLTAGTASYQYNVDGFLTTKTQDGKTTSYNYSSRGELLNVRLPDNKLIEYIHDPLGRSIAKKVNGAIVEKYLWQGLTRLLAVLDGNNSLSMRFDYADGRMPISMTAAGVKYYLGYDQVGSLKVVADGSGNLVKIIDYDSFGNIIADSNISFSVPFGFAGGLHDRDTGLVRFGYRDFDTDTGRWTAKDPIGFKGGDTDLWGYCLSNPISKIDPLGLAWVQRRPLDIFYISGKDPLDELSHDRFLFDDGTESGYYGNSRVGRDPVSKELQQQYQNIGEYLQDNILKQAVQNVAPLWDYSKDSIVNEYDLLHHNCHDYVDAVLKEYYRLKKEKENSNPCK